MDNSFLKIGRISLKTEKAMKIDLGKDPFVYLSGSDLDSLAHERPKDYLRMMEMAGEIIKRPDFGRYIEGQLCLLRAYSGSDHPRFYLVEIVKKDGLHRLKRFAFYDPDVIAFKGFRRIN